MYCISASRSACSAPSERRKSSRPSMRAFVRDQFEQPVQLHRIDPQPRGHGAKGAVAVVGGQLVGQREAGGFEVPLGAAIGPARPEGRIEQLAIGGDRLDAGEPVRRAQHADDLAAARRGIDQFGDPFDILDRRRAHPGDHVHRIAQLLHDGVVRDRADLAQAHLRSAARSVWRRDLRLPVSTSRPRPNAVSERA